MPQIASNNFTVQNANSLDLSNLNCDIVSAVTDCTVSVGKFEGEVVVLPGEVGNFRQVVPSVLFIRSKYLYWNEFHLDDDGELK